MRVIQKIDEVVARFENLLLIIIVLVMVFLSFLQVILRNVFDQGILWGDIFLRHLVLWIGFIGASLATREKKHINIDILSRFAKSRWKSVSEVITFLFAALICLVLVDASWTFVAQERMFETMLFNDIPAWYFQLIIPIGFVMMSLRFLLHAITTALTFFKAPEGGK